ncbi:aldo-keto reductase [Drechmeria coniospora]|uniref:Aldo-keto reductase n=1 Tax=Drechmeria coniospora TaxID=98403 RepID=A0A151GSH7_DRECN|nr:aldo-keto reductase [Drechmeria coniospora]KYK60057.1 aldo-keto reductase [Drechmeria coniospora]
MPPPLTIHSTASLPNNNHSSLPRLGFGVYQLYGQACTQAVLAALDVGYRHIDSAQLYRNESEVGAAMLQSPVEREAVFLTTKMLHATGDAEKTYASALDSVRKLGGDSGYVDLFLVHVPGRSREAREELWKALERLHGEGKAKAIGVSNFRVQHLQEMKDYANVWPPHVNQLELHPWCQQRELVQFCRDNDIVLQAYSPLSCGEYLGDETLARVASKHGKSPAQVLIRYGLQKNWVPLPKSGNPDRIRQNADVFDFILDDDDMETLDGLDQGATGALFPANSK